MSTARQGAPGAAKTVTLVLLLITVYLLCTSYMDITYNGAFMSAKNNNSYEEDANGIVSFNSIAYPGTNIGAGILLEVTTDTDNSVFYCHLNEIDSDIFDSVLFKVQTSSASGTDKTETAKPQAGSSAVSYSKLNYPLSCASPDMGKLLAGDTVKLLVSADVEENYCFTGAFLYNTDCFELKYIFNTDAYTTVSYSAFDLLFGSKSKQDMTFDGNLWALFFWLPPLVSIAFMIFDRRSGLKYLAGMGMAVVSIFAVVYFIGGARLAMGSMLSIVINLIIFILCLYGALTGAKKAENGK